MNTVFLLGPPCIGKSTIGKALENGFGFGYISVGEILRQADIDTSNGDLIPSHTVYNILAQELSRIPPSKIVIIDGYPKSMENVLKWELHQKWPICVLLLTSTSQVLNRRIAERLEYPNRVDDTYETMIKRQKIFQKNINCISKFYKGMLHVIEVNEGKNEVLNKVCGVLARILNEKKIIFSDGGLLTVQKVSEKATLPLRGSSFAAGYDIFSSEKTVIFPNKGALIKTDICMQPPPGTYIRIAEKSGLAYEDIRVCGGVIDSDFSKPILVLLYNHGTKPFQVKEKMKIAQAIVTQISMPAISEGKIEVNDRKGFGSTGLH